MSGSIYVAAASADLEMAEYWQRELRDAGFTIAHDWCANVRRVGDANPREASYESRREWVDANIRGIQKCRLFWLLFPDAATIGAWVELGHAAAYHRKIVISGDWKRSIFASLADHVFDTHQEAFDWIMMVKKETGT